MTGRLTLVLAVVTALAVMAAAAVLMRDHRAEEPEGRLALYPAIESQYDGASRIVIEDPARRLVLARDAAGRWMLPDNGGYPADQARVRRLMLAFGHMMVVEAKTRRADLYDRLGVGDFAAPGSRALRLTLESADSKTGQTRKLAVLLVGDRASVALPEGANGGVGRTYVRKEGDAQSWLVEGLPPITAAPADWLDPALMTIERERLRKVTIRHKTGERVEFARAAAGDPAFRISDMPRNRTVKSYGGGPLVTAAALSFLAFDDVRAADRTPDADADAVATFVTFDGLTITATVKGPWVHFTARSDAAATAAEARDLNARLKDWDYRLPDYKRKELVPELEDMLEPRPQ